MYAPGSPVESDSLPPEDAQDGMHGSRKDRVQLMPSFVVQVSGNLPPHALDRAGSVHRQTVLRATVRDQAALYGLLKVLNDLGLDLLDLCQLPGPEEAEPALRSGHGAPLTIEVVIRGSIGELTIAALSDHVELTHLSTRLVLWDRVVLGEVLDWARNAGADVEYAADTPPPMSSSVAPPVGETPGQASKPRLGRQ